MLNIKVWSMTLGCWMATSFTFCVLTGVVLPEFPAPHRSLELLLPGFTWISPWNFVLGLVESYLFGLYAGLLFVWFHNFFVRRWSAEHQAPVAKAA